MGSEVISMRRRFLDNFTGTTIELEVSHSTADLPNQDSFNEISYYPAPTQRVTIPFYRGMITYLDDKIMKFELWDDVRDYGIKKGMYLYIDVSSLHLHGIVESIDGAKATLKIVNDGAL